MRLPTRFRCVCVISIELARARRLFTPKHIPRCSQRVRRGEPLGRACDAPRCRGAPHSGTPRRLCPILQTPHSFACIAPALRKRLSWLTMANACMIGALLALIALSSDLAHLPQHALSSRHDALNPLGLLCRCTHLPGARAPRSACGAAALRPPERDRRSAAGGNRSRLEGCHAGPCPCDTAAVSGPLRCKSMRQVRAYDTLRHEHRPASQSASLPPCAHASACWPWSSAQAIREGERAHRGAGQGGGSRTRRGGPRTRPGTRASGRWCSAARRSWRGRAAADPQPCRASGWECDHDSHASRCMHISTQAVLHSCGLHHPAAHIGPIRFECIALATQQSSVHCRSVSCQYCMRSAAGHAP